jgi:hypothetical protein
MSGNKGFPKKKECSAKFTMYRQFTCQETVELME